MLFRNKGPQVKVRQRNAEGFFWVSVREGKTIDLPEAVGKAYGFSQVEKTVTPGKIGKVVVETKQFNEDFVDELTRINGLGSKTAKDIVKVYPTKKDLIKAIQNNEELPVRDDVESKLKKKFK